MNEKPTEIALREERLRIDEEALENVKHNIAMMQRAVEEVLEEGVDYGTVPGVQQPFLFDSGASKVRDFYDTYPEHIVLSRIEEDGLLTIMMETKLVYRKTGQVVASGVGAASMKESRYKYRWVEEPEEFGYNRSECRRKGTKYRILNPEVDELVNTIMKVAAKRSEVDASQNLPGVAAAIAKLRKGIASGDDRWNRFWGEVNRMGLSREDTHKICRVGSMKQWLAQGKSLEQAMDLIRQWVVTRDQELPSKDEGTLPQVKPTEEKVIERDISLIRTENDFNLACFQDFGLQPPAALKMTGYSSKMNVPDWSAAYMNVAGTKGVRVLEPSA